MPEISYSADARSQFQDALDMQAEALAAPMVVSSRTEDMSVRYFVGLVVQHKPTG